MTLQARFKPLNSLYRVLCGYINCRGELGVLFFGYANLTGPELIRASGYVRDGNTWRLGRHAARRHNYTPRRPRRSIQPSTIRPHRTREGWLMMPHDAPETGTKLRQFGTWMNSPCVERVNWGDRLTIECPRCHRLSEFVVRTPAEIEAEEVQRRARRRQSA